MATQILMLFTKGYTSYVFLVVERADAANIKLYERGRAEYSYISTRVHAYTVVHAYTHIKTRRKVRTYTYMYLAILIASLLVASISIFYDYDYDTMI